MKNTRRTLVIFASIAAFFASSAHAQTKDGHWTQGVGGPVWKNSTGLCWKQTSWTPSMAIEECDPDLVSRPASPPPPPVKPQAKPAAPVAPKPVVLRSTVQFASGKATLDEMARFR